jgi:AcrR family transcriptional regulator
VPARRTTPVTIPRERGLSPELQAQIFDAAMAVFGKKGFAGTKVEEVAEAAGLARATIYYHFRSKRDLYVFLLQEGISRLAAHVAAAVDSAASPADRLAALVDGHVDFFAKYRAFTTIALLETWRLDPSLNISPAKIMAPALEVVGRVVTEAREAGVAKDLDVEVLVSSFFGLVAAVPVYFVSYKGDFPQDAMRRALKELFLRGVLADA